LALRGQKAEADKPALAIFVGCARSWGPYAIDFITCARVGAALAGEG